MKPFPITKDQSLAFDQACSYFHGLSEDLFDQEKIYISEENSLVGSFTAHLSRCFDTRDTNPFLIYTYGEKGQELPRNYSGIIWEENDGALITKTFGVHLFLLHKYGAGEVDDLQNIFNGPWRKHPAEVLELTKNHCFVPSLPGLEVKDETRADTYSHIVGTGEECVAAGYGTAFQARSVEHAVMQFHEVDECNPYLYTADWGDVYVLDKETSELFKVYLDIVSVFKCHIDPVKNS